jgi:aryl-alcohol dehydrogenase-like predicted oxidoreductase
MPWECSIGKASASKLEIYAKSDGRYQISWYDLATKRHVATRETPTAAKSFQTQKIAELQRHRETKFDSEDRQMYSEARELARDHGCTVLQAVREWYTAKGGSINSELLGKAIQKFLTAKRTRSSGTSLMAAT